MVSRGIVPISLNYGRFIEAFGKKEIYKNVLFSVATFINDLS